MSASYVRLTPLAELRVSAFQIPAFHRFSNSSILKKPVIVYHSAFPRNTPASTLEMHFRTLGVVVPQWRYTMYQTSLSLHYP